MNIAEPQPILIHLSFEKAFYFGNMKTSKVIPVYKDNKIIEKMTYDRFYSFLTLHNCIYINQQIIQQIMRLLV